MDVLLRQSWNDPRLKFEGPSQGLTIHTVTADNIWIPDTYITNGRKVTNQNASYGNKLMRLQSDGTLFYTLR